MVRLSLKRSETDTLKQAGEACAGLNCGKVLMAPVGHPGRSCGMARRWGGFVQQNLTAKEEWELVESCEIQARQARLPESTQQPAQLQIRREAKKPIAVRGLKTKQ